MSFLALFLIWSAFCGLLALCEWLAIRKKPDALERYNTRFPKTKGFYG